jgi:hypothetical protein
VIFFFGTPVDEVGGVKGDAKEISGYEAKLSGADANHADNGAVDGGNNPALPELFAEEDSAQYGQNTGEIVESNHMKCVAHVGLMSLYRSLL